MVAAKWSPLSREGRILVLVAQNPFLTVRDLAEVLECSEKSIIRSMTNLVQSKWVRRTKVGGVHTYEVVKGMLHSSPDIQSIAALVRDKPPPTQSHGSDSTDE